MVDSREILKLKPLIKKHEKFFNNCGVHTKTFLNMYCMNCDEEPVCATGSSDEIESRHQTQGHKVLQVQKTTGMNGIKEEDIHEYAGSDIFKLKNNGRDVFAIVTRGKPEAKVLPGDQHCIHCRFVFKTNGRSQPQPNAKYCSLQCKTEVVENSRANGTAAASDCSKASSTTSKTTFDETSSCHNLACFRGSYRKRRRKALHPCRAPLH